jgi:hypothetical protein
MCSVKLLHYAVLFVTVAVTSFTACGDDVEVEIRSIDGTGNNPDKPAWGSAGSRIGRVTTVAYGDMVSSPASTTRPNPRTISNTLCDQTVSIPDERNLSDFVWTWGQFLTHDTNLVPAQDEDEAFDIPVPAGDAVFDPQATGEMFLKLNRSIHDSSTGTSQSNPRQQTNKISSWIDASMVYGPDQERASWLRSYIGGRLKVTTHPAGDLLPFNDGTQSNAGGNSTSFFVAGDVRANEVTPLIVLHTLFVREHNRLADEISAGHPDLNDEEIYQRARRIVGAEIQVITYNEYLPALLGENALDDYTGYDDKVEPYILNSFVAAAFRTGHSQVGSQIIRLDDEGMEIDGGHLSMEDAFFNPQALTNEGGIDPVLRGMAANVQEAMDLFIVDSIRNAFAEPQHDPTDVISLDIQRGREHGLCDYNRMRQDFGLDPATDFSDITSDTGVQTALQTVYGSVNEIDPIVGMLAEDHVPGASAGELIFTIIKEQFEALRDGDRFWHTIDPGFTADELSTLQNTRLSDIIQRNTGITDMQQNVFFAS